MQKKVLFFLLIMLNFSFIQAQETWDLERCVQHALGNSINIKQANVTIEGAELNKQQNKLSRLPTLNGSGSYSFLFGRSVDPTTNQFRSQQIQSNNLGLSSGVVVYRGNQITNAIRQSEYDIQAASADLEAARNDLSLNVAAAYLGILQSEDQIAIAVNRQKQTEQQLARTEKLIRAGTLPTSNKSDLEAQLASDEQAVTGAENGLVLAYLSLKQFMNLDPTYDLQISRPASIIPVEGNIEDFSVEDIYEQALNTQPQIRANEMRIRSAETGVKTAKGALQPSLSLFGGVSTNYSSVAPDIDNPEFGPPMITEVEQQVEFMNSIQTITFINETFDVTFPTQQYTKQLSDNLSENVGLSLNVPIFNGNRNKIAVQHAELGVRSAQFSDELSKIQLKSDIQRALTDAKGAYRQLIASEKTVAAREVAFSNAEKRFDIGSINSYEYNLAKDNLDVARSNKIFATYDYTFKMKVLDYYLGKPIKLN